MDLYPGAILTIKNEKWEILRADNFTQIVTCVRHLSCDRKPKDFTFEELEGK